ncbi:MAG: hypothetical protein NE327_21825 [Lentisphaeraceae bacterium]|nr:hypothetical protein [Lentisphaeraceae bacterium]
MNSEIAKLKSIITDSMYNYMEEYGGVSYSQVHVEECKTILDTFINSFSNNNLDIEESLLKVEEVVLALNELNSRCDSELIETDQREDICKLIDLVLESAGHKFDFDTTEVWREW